jgi:two-component system nitrogen regulation sensor histidine kinase GlnL
VRPPVKPAAAPGVEERELIPSLVEALFLFDREGRLARLNPAGERLLGRSERTCRGRDARALFPANPEVPGAVEGALREGRTVAHLAVRLARGAGEESFLALSVSPTQDAEGRVLGAVLLARDETLLQALERSFRKAGQLATLGTLALGFAHEIRNPLGGIKGATQLLAMELPPGSPLAEHCRVVLREVERIDALLESLMGLTPRDPPAFAPLDVNQLLLETVALIERWIGGGGAPARPPVRLQAFYGPNLPPVRGDRRALAQAFLNLLKNAVEASPPGGLVEVRSTLSTGSLLRPGSFGSAGALEAVFEDEGCGFPAGVREFSPFFTTKPKGVGLGLVISERIVQSHGGRLVLEDRRGPDGAGRGARARVILPLGPPGPAGPKEAEEGI